jgi:glutathionylspermidine synthase
VQTCSVGEQGRTLEDTATQAGLSTTLIDIEDIGLAEDGRFVDLDNRLIEFVFKLYP